MAGGFSIKVENIEKFKILYLENLEISMKIYQVKNLYC